MALLFMDGFDHYASADITEKWGVSGVTGTGTTIAIGATSGRRSSSSFRWVTGGAGNPSGYLQRVLAPADATVILGFAFRTSGVTGTAGLQIAAIRDIATTQVYLRLNSDLTLSVLRGSHASGATVLGTSSSALTTAVYAYIELKVLINNGGGTVDLRMNGLSVLSLTGLDTQQTANAQWNSVSLGTITGENPPSTNIATRDIDFDDVYVLDGSGAAPWNTFLGDCRVDPRHPTAAGASAGWTPSAGANWECVDETAPNDDTDHTTAASVGLTDTFVLQDAPVPGATIFGVQHCLNIKKTDAGVCLVAPVVRHGGTDAVGSDLGPSSAYAYVLGAQQTNPGTSAAWVEADFNAAEFGYQRTA